MLILDGDQIVERRGHYRILTSAADLADHMRSWEEAECAGTGFDGLPVGVIIGLEGADPILDTDTLTEFHAAGLRIVSLTHYDTSAYGARHRHRDRRRAVSAGRPAACRHAPAGHRAGRHARRRRDHHAGARPVRRPGDRHTPELLGVCSG